MCLTQMLHGDEALQRRAAVSHISAAPSTSSKSRFCLFPSLVLKDLHCDYSCLKINESLILNFRNKSESSSLTPETLRLTNILLCVSCRGLLTDCTVFIKFMETMDESSGLTSLLCVCKAKKNVLIVNLFKFHCLISHSLSWF